MAEQLRETCGEFGIATVSASGDPEDEKVVHEVYLSFSASDEGDDEGTLLYAYPGELSVLAPVAISPLKAERDLSTQYPELFAQLELFAAAEGEAEKIAALQKLTLTIDWDAYPHLEEDDRTALLSMIEVYIASQLQFDVVMYSLIVHGDVIGHDINGNELIGAVEKPTQLTAYMGLVQLRNDDDPSTYTVALTAFAPAETRENGSNMFQIPVVSLASIHALRNGNLFAGQELGTYETPVPDIAVYPIETATPYSEQGEQMDDVSAETDDMSIEGIALERHREVTEMYEDLLQKVDKHMQYYETLEEAKAAANAIIDEVDQFLDAHPRDFYPIVCAEGEGVVHINAAINKETTSVDEAGDVLHVEIPGVMVRNGDIFTSKNGILLLNQQVEANIVGVELDVDGESRQVFRPRVYLAYQDIDSEQPLTLNAPYNTTPLYTLSSVRRFLVELNSDRTSLSLPAYACMQRIEASLDKLTNDYSDMEFLPIQIRDLYAELRSAGPSAELRDLSDPELLVKIGSQVGGDEEVVQETVDVLGEILRGFSVEVRGAMYMIDGTRYDDVTIRGQLADVVSTLGSLGLEEPLLVVEQEDTTWYVPLAEIERFRY